MLIHYGLKTESADEYNLSASLAEPVNTEIISSLIKSVKSSDWL